MFMRNTVTQFVGVGKTKGGNTSLKISLSKDDLDKFFGETNSTGVTIMVFPDNEIKVTSKGVEYITGSVLPWSKEREVQVKSKKKA